MTPSRVVQDRVAAHEHNPLTINTVHSAGAGHCLRSKAWWSEYGQADQRTNNRASGLTPLSKAGDMTAPATVAMPNITLDRRAPSRVDRAVFVI